MSIRPPSGPPASSRSVSELAAATHGPPTRCIAPMSAVTRPPAPRPASSSPVSPRSNATGPRFEATTRGAWSMLTSRGPPPADVAADDRLALPHALGHDEAESLARGLLHDDIGGMLERADLEVTDPLEVREQMDVRVAGSMLLREVQEPHPLGGVACVGCGP